MHRASWWALLTVLVAITVVMPANAARPSQRAPTHWQAINDIPETIHFTDVDLLSATRAWATGRDSRNGADQGVVYRLSYEGGRWRAALDVTLPAVPLAIQVLSDNDVWAVGESTLLAHRHAGRWHQISVRRGSDALRAVHIASNGQTGWATGERVTSTASTGPMLLRYAYGSWLPDAGITGDSGGGMNGLAIVNEHGWAVGNPGIWRYGDGHWERDTAPLLCEGCFLDLQDVDAVAPDDAWTVGYRSPTCAGCDFTLAVFHYAEGRWQAAGPVDEPRETSMLHGVDFADQHNGWAVGNLGNGDNRPLIVRYHEGAWTYDDLPIRSGRLTAVSVLDAGHALAVGDNGIILSYGYDGSMVDERCFGETGQCIGQPFRDYWEQNGGLAVFGYPSGRTTREVNRDTGATYLTQWFERARLEVHAENAPPYHIMLGRLGDDLLQQRGEDWRTLPRGQPEPDCLWFAATSQSVCDQQSDVGFKSYWLSHGLEFDGKSGVSDAESVALFGLPLTEPVMATNSSGDTVVMQWFERARFEYHPDNPAEYRVLLGLLGAEVHSVQQR